MAKWHRVALRGRGLASASLRTLRRLGLFRGVCQHSIDGSSAVWVPDISTFAEAPYDRGFDEYQCIFVHVPKAAGQSVKDAIFGTQVRLGGHFLWSEYHNKDESRFEHYYKFAFVRNPWDRVLSAFTYLKGKAGKSQTADSQWAAEYLACAPDFGHFVRNILPEAMQSRTVPHFAPQWHFLFDHQQHLMVDFVGRFERIEADFLAICKRLRINRRLPHVHKSYHRKYVDAYTPELEQAIANLYAEDIEHLGYTFQGYDDNQWHCIAGYSESPSS